MADNLTLGVLFRAIEDGSFRRVTTRLETILKGLNTSMAQTQQQGSRFQNVLSKIAGTSKQAGDGLEGAAKKSAPFNKQIGFISKGLDRLIRGFQVIAVYTVAGRLFSGLTSGLRSAVDNIIEFDQALYNLKAITGATSGEIAAMRDVIGKTAVRTKFSSTEIAEGMVLLGQAGLNAGESIKAIEAVSDLAAGTLSNFRDVADLVTTTLRAFNIDAGETRRIADVMANAVNKSKLTIDKLRTAFNYVGAGAAQAGLSLEQTTQAMMLLANNGMRASTIGTGLRQVLARLLAPSGKLRTAMAEYGLQLDKASGEADWFEKQIAKLTTVMYDFDKQTVDMSKAYELFGLRGAQAAAILVNSYMKLDGTWNRMLANVKEIGAAQKMMETQAEGLGFKVKNLVDQLKEFAIVAGEAGSGGALGGMVDTLRSATTGLIAFAKTGVGQAVVNAVALTGALFTLKLAIQAIAFALVKVGGGVGAFFTGPVGIAIMAIATLAAIVVSFTGRTERLNRELEKNIAVNRGIVASYSNYKTQLMATKEGSEEYNAVVDRLIQSHPELADAIRMSNKSLEDMLGIINKFEKKNLESIWADSAKRIQNVARSLSDAIIKWEGLQEGQRAFGYDFMTFFKSMKGMGKDAEAIEQAVQGWAMDLYKIREDSGQFKKMWEDISKILVGVGKDIPSKETQALIERAMSYDLTTQDIISSTKEWAAEGKMIDVIIGQILINYQRLVAETNIVLARHRQLRAEAQDLMEKLGWRKFYESLDALKKFDFMEIWDKVSNEWGKRAKFIEREERKNFKTQEEFNTYLFEMQKKFYRKEIEEALNKNDKIEDNYKEHLRKMEKLRVEKFGSDFDKQYIEAKQYYNKLEEDIDKNAKNQEESRKQLYTLWLGFYQDLQEMVDKYGHTYALVTLKEIEAEMQRIADRAKVGLSWEAKLPGESRTPAEKERMSPEDWKKAMEEVDKWEKEQVKIKAEETEAAYRRGEVSAEEYFKALENLYDKDGISWKELQDIKRRETQSTWENLKEGWKNFFSKMETTGEWLQRIGEEIPEKLADGFGEMWGDFLSGTKSAKEAFSDFARDMLRWLAQILAKRAMMQALSWIGFHGGGMYGEGTGAPRRLKGPMFVPKLHSGLMPDEFPAILKKDEGVFTPKQMKALGAMINGGTSINVPVTVNGGMADRAQRYLPGEIEEAVLKTMRKYM